MLLHSDLLPQLEDVIVSKFKLTSVDKLRFGTERTNSYARHCLFYVMCYMLGFTQEEVAMKYPTEPGGKRTKQSVGQSVAEIKGLLNTPEGINEPIKGVVNSIVNQFQTQL